MEGPVARVVGEHVESADGADGYINSRLRNLCGLRNPSAIGTGHSIAVAVKVDRMAGHAEITHAYAHLVAKAHRQRIDPGKDAGIPRPHVEIGHLVNLWQISTGIHEVEIGRASCRERV